MTKKIKNPVVRGLDAICGGNDAAIGRVFGVTRQSVGQWRKYGSMPRHFMRTFSAMTGVSVDEMLEYAELTNGIRFEAFAARATKLAKQEA